MSLALLLANVVIVRSVLADPVVLPPDAGALAVETGRAALDAYQGASWEIAYAKFEEAERLVHSPVFVLYMARCKRNLGLLLEARKLYRAVAEEASTPDAPLPWSQAVASAHAELGTLQQNIPSLWIRPPPGSDVVRVTVDARDIALSTDGNEVELDPGEHVIELWRAEGSIERRRVHVREGRRRIPIWLSNRRMPVAAPALLERRPSAEPSRALSRNQIVGYTALGVGTVGIVTGVVTGLLAMARTDSLKGAYCNEGGDCYPAARGRVEAASDWAALSTVGFIFGSSALAVGAAVLLVVPDPGGSQPRLVLQGAL